jgi:hypothetical protein
MRKAKIGGKTRKSGTRNAEWHTPDMHLFIAIFVYGHMYRINDEEEM